MAIDMSTAILTLSENGELQRIHEKWLSKKACSSSFQSAEAENEQLRLNSFRGLFLICGIACFLALLIYFSSMLCRFTQSQNNNRSAPPPSTSNRPPTSHYSARIQTFLNFVDEKEDATSHSQSTLKRKIEEDISSSITTINNVS